ncbi:unnamed protein product [Allacma fusca]|uniref:Uncharacterized protein n=1 Tax=Allacma fusca TaxID=39272 RepID=A0A8J2KDA7_9HEXA|nr:unnamed protein product [Allacma fusca]
MFLSRSLCQEVINWAAVNTFDEKKAFPNAYFDALNPAEMNWGRNIAQRKRQIKQVKPKGLKNRLLQLANYFIMNTIQTTDTCQQPTSQKKLCLGKAGLPTRVSGGPLHYQIRADTDLS